MQNRFSTTEQAEREKGRKSTWQRNGVGGDLDFLAGVVGKAWEGGVGGVDTERPETRAVSSVRLSVSGRLHQLHQLHHNTIYLSTGRILRDTSLC